MNINSLYTIILLTAVWIILQEGFTILIVVSGLAISVCCVFFARRFLPMPRPAPIKPLRLLLYLFFLLGQMYSACFMVIKIIFTGAHVEIVEIQTKLTNKFLQTILVNSITLVPGSVSLGLAENKITVLWLKKKNDVGSANADEFLKGKLERVLIKAQK